MIKLTNQIIAVEVPKGSKGIFVSHWPKSNPELMYLTRKDNPVSVKLTYGIKYSLIGVTPLSEEQAESIVEWIENEQYYRDYRKEGWQGDIAAVESFNSLLEFKGLDINKKYAILRIEKTKIETKKESKQL